MHKKVMSLLPVLFVVGGCAGAPKGCYRPTAFPTCELPQGDAVVKVNLGDGNRRPSAEPACLSVAPGTSVRIEIESATEKNLVVTIPKRARDVWLLGTNSSDDSDDGGTPGQWQDRILISVPNDKSLARPGGKYDFTVLSAKGQCLDPRIRIN